ncbi:hypothetical protein NE237_016807 [Protea cynaroides]|uniref:Uncharacterized protein n=1 Tax=Protea cynaroides TaxID=273540 RepID=A0A9Q0HHM5_9MAGN|nr:hypothetical protein NE237_016807 [Protea cynaroides]
MENFTAIHPAEITEVMVLEKITEEGRSETGAEIGWERSESWEKPETRKGKLLLGTVHAIARAIMRATLGPTILSFRSNILDPSPYHSPPLPLRFFINIPSRRQPQFLSRLTRLLCKNQRGPEESRNVIQTRPAQTTGSHRKIMEEVKNDRPKIKTIIECQSLIRRNCRE